MLETDLITNGGPLDSNEFGIGIDSRFRLIVVAAQRNKQLCRGSKPRIEVDPLRRRNTTIAVEEVKRGLVPFKLSSVPLAAKEPILDPI